MAISIIFEGFMRKSFLISSFIFLTLNCFGILVEAQSIEKNPTVQPQLNFSNETPNILFGVKARLIASRLCCPDIEVANFPITVGNSFPFSTTWNDSGRRGSSVGSVTPTTISGTFSSGVIQAQTVNPFWKGLFEETNIVVYIKQNPLYVYNYDQSITGTMQSTASTPNAGADVYINNISANTSNSPRSYNYPVHLSKQPLVNCGHTFNAYPNTSYCAVRTINIDSGTLAINGSSVLTDIDGSTNGNFQIAVSVEEIKPILIDKIKNTAITDKLGVKYYYESSTGNVNDIAGLQIRECLAPHRKWQIAPWEMKIVRKRFLCGTANLDGTYNPNGFLPTILDPNSSNRRISGDEHSAVYSRLYPFSTWRYSVSSPSEQISYQRYQWRIGNSEWKDLEGAQDFKITHKVWSVEFPKIRSWYFSTEKHGFTYMRHEFNEIP